MARLTAPNGAKVTVAADKVDGLVKRGFKKSSESSTKAPAKKAASSKTENTK